MLRNTSDPSFHFQARFNVSYGIGTNSQLGRRIVVTANVTRYFFHVTDSSFIVTSVNLVFNVPVLVGIQSMPHQVNSTRRERLTWSTAYWLHSTGLSCPNLNDKLCLRNKSWNSNRLCFLSSYSSYCNFTFGKKNKPKPFNQLIEVIWPASFWSRAHLFAFVRYSI